MAYFLGAGRSSIATFEECGIVSNILGVNRYLNINFPTVFKVENNAVIRCTPNEMLHTRLFSCIDCNYFYRVRPPHCRCSRNLWRHRNTALPCSSSLDCRDLLPPLQFSEQRSSSFPSSKLIWNGRMGELLILGATLSRFSRSWLRTEQIHPSTLFVTIDSWVY